MQQSILNFMPGTTRPKEQGTKRRQTTEERAAKRREYDTTKRQQQIPDKMGGRLSVAILQVGAPASREVSSSAWMHVFINFGRTSRLYSILVLLATKKFEGLVSSKMYWPFWLVQFFLVICTPALPFNNITQWNTVIVCLSTIFVGPSTIRSWCYRRSNFSDIILQSLQQVSQTLKGWPPMDLCLPTHFHDVISGIQNRWAWYMCD